MFVEAIIHDALVAILCICNLFGTFVNGNQGVMNDGPYYVGYLWYNGTPMHT